MTALELAREFISNPDKLGKYNEAISLLRESGFESVIRRLAEPMNFPLEHPKHMEISAFEQAERRGWFQALDCLFDFFETIDTQTRTEGERDYGAKEQLSKLGYNFSFKTEEVN